jgi:phage terminase small subunit
VALTDKQEAFVREYLLDMNAAAAYVRAGYEVADGTVAASCAYKLLRNAHVASAIDREQVARMEKLRIDADWVVERFKLVYLRAMTDDDYAAANRAYTEADAERIRSELVARGFDFTRKNWPGTLPPNGEHA